MECVPKDPCWHIDDDVSCAFSGCIWDNGLDFCHPHPDAGGQDCNAMNYTYCNQNLDECEWNAVGNHCQPKAVGGDCYSYHDEFGCDNSNGCEWNAPIGWILGKWVPV